MDQLAIIPKHILSRTMRKHAKKKKLKEYKLCELQSLGNCYSQRTINFLVSFAHIFSQLGVHEQADSLSYIIFGPSSSKSLKKCNWCDRIYIKGKTCKGTCSRTVRGPLRICSRTCAKKAWKSFHHSECRKINK